MDGIDGMVAGTLFVSILTCLIYFKIGQPYILLLSSLTAFLLGIGIQRKYLWVILEYFLAAINIGLISLSNNLSDTLGLILILTPCLLDPFICVLIRYFNNQNILKLIVTSLSKTQKKWFQAI